jgi:hypothetical protein
MPDPPRSAMAARAIESVKNQTEAASLAAGKADESRFQDQKLIDTIKEKIIALLLSE